MVASDLSGINRVRYGPVSASDRESVERYVGALQSLQISAYNRREQLAYWINLYNAATVDVVLRYYPVKSIKDIKLANGWFNSGPWRAKLLKVEGEALSQDDIEHRILRPIRRDNRIHYAVNCASLGCPHLLPAPYTGDNVELLLQRGAREYVNHPRGVGLRDGRLHVSSIYVWFEEDFGGSRERVLRHLRRHAASGLARSLQTYRGSFSHDYDGSLNAP